MIKIQQSKTADTRTCDFTKVTKDTLYASSQQHINDVEQAMLLFVGILGRSASVHDFDKLTDIDSFHEDFVTGFKQTAWWDRHRKLNRHHLIESDGVPADVNLIDVLDFVADCVMAGMARTGSVRPLTLSNEVLQLALKNTADLLQSQVEVVDEEAR